MGDEELMRRLAALAERHGMAWQRRPWPGFDPATKSHFASDPDELAHELGHFLVAPTTRKVIAHFGLGDPADRVGMATSFKVADREERAASIIGAGLIYECGSAKTAEAVLLDHGWLEPTAHGDSDTRRVLRTKNVARHLKPKTRRWLKEVLHV